MFLIFFISMMLLASVILGTIFKNKNLQNIVDNNAFLIIPIIYFFYLPCQS